MITSKQELKYYLECDKKALGINSTISVLVCLRTKYGDIREVFVG